MIQNRSDVNERHSSGLTPLHFSIAWPAGLSMLLEAGAVVDCPDYRGGTPLNYACCWGSEDSVRTLLRAGSTPFAEGHPDNKNRTGFNLFRDFCRSDADDKIMKTSTKPSKDTLQLLLDAIAARREGLRNLALEKLSRQDAVELGLLWTNHLDHNAKAVVRALRRDGYDIPRELCTTSQRSLFFDVRTAGQADRLYSSGFRDIDVFDGGGFAPIHRISQSSEANRPDLLRWFFSRGVDACQTTMEQQWNVLHILADGGYEPPDFPAAAVAAQAGASLLAHDVCDCACSSAGCHPTTKLMSYRNFWDDGWYLRSRRFQKWVEAVCQTALEMKQAWEDFARAEKFLRLGISHTCCRHSGWSSSTSEFTQEDVLEIQEEESELIEDLETWMDLYHEQFAHGLDFVTVDWAGAVDRLDEMLGPYHDLERDLDRFAHYDVEWQYRQQNRDRAAGRLIKPIEHMFLKVKLELMLEDCCWRERRVARICLGLSLEDGENADECACYDCRHHQ